jgi:hypothetical protein
MPAVRAERVCPTAIFIAPDFTRYRAVSKSVREIFKRHTDLIEPLSLDEAYLDVTQNKTSLPTATLVARTIRKQIRQELNLTASAGVAPNKFLAKLASDWRKPDGLFVIQPEEVGAFLLPLPVGRLPGVGKVTEEKLAMSVAKTPCEFQSEDFCKLSDEELTHYVASGRHDALAVLFDRYHRLVFDVALRIVRDPGEAEEVVQNVFLDVYRAMANFDSKKGILKVWLLQPAK